MGLENYRLLAIYNRWMNRKLYAVCAEFSDEVRKQDRSVPFRSMHGLLNHILLADRVWFGRFTGNPYPATALDQELYSDFEELRAARDAEDERIIEWVNGLSPEDLGREIRFRAITAPEERACPLWFPLTQAFNHQTHHRGQLTALIEQAGGDCGVTDFFALPQGPVRLTGA